MPSGPRPERSERRLVRAAKRGSREAFEELFRMHWARAHRTAFLIVRDGAAAEDIAQESFVAALRHLDRFDGRRPLGPWLNRIVVNRAIDWTRTRRLRAEVGAEPWLDDRREAAVEGPDSRAEQVPAPLMDALGRLSPERRAVVVMRYLLDYTPSEIADALELPTGTVNSRLRRALDQLGAEYGEAAGG
ncbi:MAG: RNA polymerase sigma factor [Solirubrobacterales bacterium]